MSDEEYEFSPEGYALAARLAALPPEERLAALEEATGPRREPEAILELFLRAHEARIEGRALVIEL